MNLNSLYPCGRISRRRLIHQAAGGFMGLALGTLFSEQSRAAEQPNAIAGPHFPALHAWQTPSFERTAPSENPSLL